MQWIAQVARRPRHARRSATVAMHMRATGRDAAQYRSRFSSYVGGGVLCSSASDGRAGTWRSNALADSSLCSVAAAPSAAKRRSLALADCVLCSVTAAVSHMGFACGIALKSFSAMRNLVCTSLERTWRSLGSREILNFRGNQGGRRQRFMQV